MKKIILTGGGTAGHVTANIALLPALKAAGYDILYIGSYTGIERDLIQAENLPYRGIATGKFRRYFSLKNVSDPFRVIKGYWEARKIIKTYQPDVVFSKGGFVSVPVVLAAKAFHVPVVLHESDMTPGLANKLSLPAAAKVCCNFPETVGLFPPGKAILTGTPIRQALLSGSKPSGFAITGLSPDKPVLLMMGGSTGSQIINKVLRETLPLLLPHFHVIHLCGKGNVQEDLVFPGYLQYAYLREELPDIFAISDLVLSRAGANAICEILALKKPNILVPLSARVSRGDQILNAASFQKQGFSYVLQEEAISPASLMDAINLVWKNRSQYICAMEKSNSFSGIEAVMAQIKDVQK